MRLRGTKMNIQDHYGHTNAENDMSLVQCMYVGMSLVNSIYCTFVYICIHYLVCIRNVKRSGLHCTAACNNTYVRKYVM